MSADSVAVLKVQFVIDAAKCGHGMACFRERLICTATNSMLSQLCGIDVVGFKEFAKNIEPLIVTKTCREIGVGSQERRCLETVLFQNGSDRGLVRRQTE